jgi:hypothetical protein
MLSATSGRRGVHHVRAARLLAIANVIADRSCGRLKMLLAPLPVALDVLSGVHDGGIGRHFPTIAWGWVTFVTPHNSKFWNVTKIH